MKKFHMCSHFVLWVYWYCYMFQGIRGRQGFKEGIHRWKITEIKTFSPCVSLDEMHETANKLHVGVGEKSGVLFLCI